jgi:glycosyltransferase involved in cell wall biosynthesis
MRIVQVVESLDLGGVERLAIQLATAERARGHDCSIYCIFRSGVQSALAQKRGIRVRCFNKRPGPSLKSLSDLVRALRSDRPDVVHTHNSGIHHYAAVAARLAGVPVVVNTRHSPFAPEHMKREKHYRWSMKLTDKVVFVSASTRDQVFRDLKIQHLPSTVILNGIPVQEYLGQNSSGRGRAPHLVFGTLGRLVPIKAHDVLITAFAQLVKSRPEARLRIAGTGPMMSALEQQISEQQLSGKVTLEGATLMPERFYRDLNVFVLPSHSEGMPLALLEAMASGLPVIATAVGGVPEVVSDEVGWLCPPGEPDQLAAAMRKAIEATDLPARGAAAVRVASSRFDLEVMCSQYLRLFDVLLDCSPGWLARAGRRRPDVAPSGLREID